MKAFATTFTLLAIVLAVILESAPTQAWRPQGRFGKRRMDQAEAQSSPNAVPEGKAFSFVLHGAPGGPHWPFVPRPPFTNFQDSLCVLNICETSADRCILLFEGCYVRSTF